MIVRGAGVQMYCSGVSASNISVVRKFFSVPQYVLAYTKAPDA